MLLDIQANQAVEPATHGIMLSGLLVHLKMFVYCRNQAVVLRFSYVQPLNPLTVMVVALGQKNCIPFR